jgi:hypothetical protein
MTAALTATIEPPPAGDGEVTVTLRIANGSAEAVEVLNPDLGQPSPGMRWPWSVTAYRAAVLLSFGYLALAVADEEGDPVEPEPVQPWATPVLRPPVELGPGATLAVPVPLAPFFPLDAGRAYRVAVDYGVAPVTVHAEGGVTAP